MSQLSGVTASSHASPLSAATSEAAATKAAMNSPSNPVANSKTTFGTMAELKERSPKLYKQMMMGIGMNIISEMRSQQERLKKAIKGQSQG